MIGLDPRVIGRMEPAPDAADCPPNFLACVEFSAPELPWLFTPARPSHKGDGREGRLAPWIVLVVVETNRSSLDVSRVPLPVLVVGTDQLPDLDDSWGWAHIQETDRPSGSLGAGSAPGYAVSRLVCPRRLRENTGYRACVVPAFLGGMQAGRTGSSPADDSSEYDKAWEIHPTHDVNLPVYLHWEFRTGDQQGFEELVRRLKPAEPDTVDALGSRAADISQPWRGHTLSEESAILHIQGALRPFGDPPPDTASPQVRADLTRLLSDHLNKPASMLAGLAAPGPGDEQAEGNGSVAPPLYGGRHVNRDRVEPGQEGWLEALNLDPATRLAARIGGDCVRSRQETLMATAWQQLGAAREANRLRAIAELATGLCQRLHDKHVAPLTTAELMRFTAPVAPRLRGGPAPSLGLTVATETTVSALPNGVATSTFARLMRPAGPVARAMGTPVENLVRRGLDGDVTVPVPAPVVPADLAAPDISPDGGGTASDIRIALNAAKARIVGRALVTVSGMTNTARVLSAPGGDAELPELPDDLPTLALARGDMDAVQTFVMDNLPMAMTSLHAVADSLVDGHSAMTAHGVRVDTSRLRTQVVGALQPGTRVGRRLADRVKVPADLRQQGPLDPVQMHPLFPVPTALYLLETAPEWFLPGMQGFPADRTVLLTPNDRFVEAFLVGLNHEMNCELHWREYPTDRIGTGFKRFWPRPDGQWDIPPISAWATGDLGRHLTSAEGALTALLVRGEVIRRFPDVIVSAAPAWAPPPGDQHLSVSGTEWWKAPTGVIPVDPSTRVYLFDIPRDALRNRPTRESPGWFIVFQENCQRLRFGFDEVPSTEYRTWHDLDWSKVPQDSGHPGFAKASGSLAPPSDPGDARWSTDAADVARISLQLPFQLRIHAYQLVGEDR
ncbi:hypothetical protein STRCI_000027 [Streptomyces cinnabarinus]|uniref:Uncharacterized protein n=1 Tax=Streptomyces cinnabarinus TaxID=67287 RepID=A0ABY7K5X8_9ACTN|nr:hypothetical protein [Streptomyces cinnabarinus]WAZ19010.1 hypothetical protein STRCI_000027 [Streptomyces cinnabarinus]